jgi:chitinase
MDTTRPARRRLSSFARSALCALLALAACSDPAAVTAPSARRAGGPAGSAAPAGRAPTALQAAGSGRCLDVSGQSREPGAEVFIYDCWSGPNQTWDVPPVGERGEIRVYGDRCLDVWLGKGDDGDRVSIYPCHGGPNQQWVRTAGGEIRGMHDKCLDVWAEGRENRTPVVIWPCHGRDNQRWTAPGVDDPPPPAAPARPTARRRRVPPWVMGYYVGYQRALYPEHTVNFGHMTHVIMGAIQATPAGEVETHFWIDALNGPAVARTIAARAHQAGRKALLMLGGMGYRDPLVSASSDANRARFVANLLQTVDALGYDGIDVDWEPVLDPDKPLLLQLLRDLRAARPDLILTVPVSWVNTNFGADPWYAQLAAAVDRLNLMSYQMADNWGGWVSWHSAALFDHGGNRPSSVSGSVDAYTALGVPAAKLGVGVGAYGSCWRGVDEMRAPIDGTPARVWGNDNEMSFATIRSVYYDAAAYRWDDAAKSGYLSFAAPVGPGQCTMVSYEDERSVAEKGRYVRARGLGGAIVWTVQQGHVAQGGSDPLLEALYASSGP